MSLQPLFHWIEGTPLAVAVNNSTYAFALIESAHLVALAVIGGAVLVVDLRMFGVGFKNQPVAAVAMAARPWLIGSLAAMLLTGYLLFSTLAGGKYYWNIAYWWKMYFLLAAIVYTFTVRQPFALRRAANASAAVAKLVASVSIFLWLGVAVMGRAIGFI
jgi:hypothetical protein